MIRFLKQVILNELRVVRDRWVLERIAARYRPCRIDSRAVIRIRKHCTLTFGRQVVIGAFNLISIEPEGVTGPQNAAHLEVGDDTYIGEFNNIRVDGTVRIGKKCLISQGVSIIGSNHSFAVGTPIVDQSSRRDKLGVTIGDDVWLGTNSTVLPGVTIGSGAVVAAGSVVNKDVPENAIVAGVPAKIVRMRQ